MLVKLAKASDCIPHEPLHKALFAFRAITVEHRSGFRASKQFIDVIAKSSAAFDQLLLTAYGSYVIGLFEAVQEVVDALVFGVAGALCDLVSCELPTVCTDFTDDTPVVVVDAIDRLAVRDA